MQQILQRILIQSQQTIQIIQPQHQYLSNLHKIFLKRLMKKTLLIKK
jgi:hypothetical protein